MKWAKRYRRNKLHGYILLLIIVSALAGIFLYTYYSHSPQGYAKSFYRTCYAQHQDSSIKKQFCYSDLFKPITLTKGPQFALQILTDLQVLDPDMGVDCHYIAHAIGKEILERDPDHWNEYLFTLPPVCRLGVAHGLLEAYFNEKGLTRETFRSICDKAETVDGYCYHMVGHVLLAENGGNINKTLDMCDWLDNAARRHVCYASTFMENETSQMLIAHGLADQSNLDWKTRLPQLKKMCRGYTGDRAVGCWMETGLVAISAEDSNISAIFASCNDNPPSVWAAHECIKYASEILSSSLDMAHLANSAHEICAAYPSAIRPECDWHVVIPFTMAHVQDIADIISFCAAEEGTDEGECFRSLGVFYYMYGSGTPFSPDEWKTQCSAAPAEWQSACENGGAINVERNFRWDAPYYRSDPVWDGSKWVSTSSPQLNRLSNADLYW